jgi:hypothetical protein
MSFTCNLTKAMLTKLVTDATAATATHHHEGGVFGFVV